MKFFFFFFGVIKFVLVEGGSVCGCGRVCEKEEWDYFDNYIFYLGLKLLGRKCLVNCVEVENLGYMM